MRYHEAGHALAFYALGFRPRIISGSYAGHDGRTTSFARVLGKGPETDHARTRAEDYAVCLVAGAVAESKYCGRPLAELRLTVGSADYENVYSISEDLMIYRNLEDCAAVRGAQVHLWESRAQALIGHPMLWASTESLAEELRMHGDRLIGKDLVLAIERGIRTVAEFPDSIISMLRGRRSSPNAILV